MSHEQLPGVLNYHAESINVLRAEHRALYKLSCSFVAYRADLSAAYREAGACLSPAEWVEATQRVLHFSEEVLLQLLRTLYDHRTPATVEPLAPPREQHIFVSVYESRARPRSDAASAGRIRRAPAPRRSATRLCT